MSGAPSQITNSQRFPTSQEWKTFEAVQDFY